MKTLDNISNRLPQFMRIRERDSVVSSLLSFFSYSIVLIEKDLEKVKKAHWIETSFGNNLDLIGKIFKLKRKTLESDELFRRRIKNFLQNFIGGGTKIAILTQVSSFLNIDQDEDIPTIIENPRKVMDRKLVVKNNEVIDIQSQGIFDEDFRITIIVQDGGYELKNPKLENPATTDSLTYTGYLKSNQKLEIDTHLKKASLDGKDVTKNINFNNLKIPRKNSTWIFSEETSPLIGRFDTAEFDSHVFNIEVPECNILLTWSTNLASSFEIQIKKPILSKNDISLSEMEEFINSVKAAGVKSFILVVDN